MIKYIHVEKLHPYALLLTVLVCFFAFSCNAQTKRYWNENLPLTSFRLPPPPLDARINYIDLDKDGDPDLLQTVTINDFPVQWIDDDDDMQEGQWSGDLDSDCLMIDRNRDGEYGGPHDLIVDWNDEDGKADMQVIADQLGLEENDFYPGHYMIMLDTDADQVFNYIDWDTFQVEAWEHSGTSRFFKDYHGHSIFLKAPLPTFAQEDLSLNWENPFLFYDPDEDGHTELTIRVLDTYIRKKSPKGDPLPKNKKRVTNEMRNIRYDGMIDLIAIGWDMDNDGAAGTEFDFDMSLQLLGKGFSYLDQDADHYQGWRGGRDTVTTKFPLIRYEDTNKNGFIDLVQYDLDGDATYEHQLDFKELGVNDEQTVITTKEMEYEDMEALFKKVARARARARVKWKRAFEAVEVAEKLGIETAWYANFKQAHSLREQYHFGYWLNFYLYMDMRDFAMRKKDDKLLQNVDIAYVSGNGNTIHIAYISNPCVIPRINMTIHRNITCLNLNSCLF